MSEDYYKILGIEKNATQEEIKKAFRKKAHQYHPDKNNGDDSKFKEVNEAYTILSDENKRKNYDSFGQAGTNSGFSGSQSAGFDGFDFSGFSGSQSAGFDFSDIFSDMFSQNRGGNRREKKGTDLQTNIKISFKESVFGTKKEIKLKKNVSCSDCNSTGAENGTSFQKCKKCSGAGYTNEVVNSIFGQGQTQVVCSVCLGKGEVPKNICKKCSGQGVEYKKEEIKFEIPAGVETGSILRLRNKGEAIKNGQSGDLYINVEVSKEENFEKRGSDIYTTKEIKITDATLGSEVKIKTISDYVTIKIPQGSSDGNILKIKNEGFVISEKQRGDLYVILKIKIPQKLSKKERELFNKLREENL